MRPELARHFGRTEDQILPCPLATQPAGWLMAQLVLVVLLLWPGFLRAGPVEEALTGIPQSCDAARQSVETWPDGVVENANLLSDVTQPRSQQGEDRVLGEPSLALLDTRIILVQLVQNTGANEHLKLLQAQRVTSQSSNGGDAVSSRGANERRLDFGRSKDCSLPNRPRCLDRYPLAHAFVHSARSEAELKGR